MLRSIIGGLVPTGARFHWREVPLDATETKLEDCQRDIEEESARLPPGFPEMAFREIAFLGIAFLRTALG